MLFRVLCTQVKKSMVKLFGNKQARHISDKISHFRSIISPLQNHFHQNKNLEGFVFF